MIIDKNQAFQLLRDGEVVSLPTETVYGLAARIDHEKAISKIFTTKERPSFDPLIIHVSGIDMAKEFVSSWSSKLGSLCEKFWPGPLTIVLPKNSKVSSQITSGQPTVAIRCPDHPIFLEMIQKLGVPLAAPSANKFGKTSPTCVEHVLEEFEGKVPVVDGGPCKLGIESTIIQLHDDGLEVLRPGTLGTKDISQIIPGISVQLREKNHLPGGLENHYQPAKPLILFSKEILIEKLPSYLQDKSYGELQLNENHSLAARELYGQLRLLSKSTEYSFIVLKNFEQYQKKSSWTPIVDRLLKASSSIF